MNINETIKQRRLQLGLNANDVAEALGISRATLYRYESHEIEKLPISVVEPLAEILDITPMELMGWNEQGLKGKKTIPLVGTIACGSPILAEENIEEYIAAPIGCEADFALRCRGDSMIRARICDGDIVFIHSQPDCSNGEIAVTLMPENSEYSPLVYRREQMNEIRILGKAVGFISYLN